MKKYVIFFCISIFSLALWSCNGGDEEPPKDPEIVLSTPANGASFDLANIQSISFDWTNVDAAEGYELVVSLSENMASPQKKAASLKPLVVSASDFDVMAAALGVGVAETATLYWSIQATRSTQTILTQVRSMSVTRLPKPVIVLPETSELTLDANDFESFEFTWTPVAGVTNYKIKFGAADNSFPLEFDPTGANKFEFEDADHFDAVLSDIPMDMGETKTIYWTVVPATANDNVVSMVRSFTGKRKVQQILLEEPAEKLTIPADHPNGTLDYVNEFFTLDANNRLMIGTFVLYTFKWFPIDGVSAYSIRFALAPEKLSSASNYESIDIEEGVNTFKFTSLDDFDAMLENLGMEREESKIVYWTVVPTNSANWPVTQWLSFTGIRKYKNAPLALEHHVVTGFDTPVAGTANSLWDGLWTQTYIGGGGAANNDFAYPWANESAYLWYGANVANTNLVDDKPTPTWFTFKTGQPVKLAKYRHYNYWPYRWTSPLFWEIWAFTGTGAPTAAGGWDDWEKIGEGDTDHLPTWNHPDQRSRIETYLKGETITFPNTVPTAQYYRFKCLENWHWKNGETFNPQNAFASIALTEIICWAQ